MGLTYKLASKYKCDKDFCFRNGKQGDLDSLFFTEHECLTAIVNKYRSQISKLLFVDKLELVNQYNREFYYKGFI